MSNPGRRLRDEINDLLRVGLSAADASARSTERYDLPTFDPGSPLITDIRLLSDLLDADDDARGSTNRS